MTLGAMLCLLAVSRATTAAEMSVEEVLKKMESAAKEVKTLDADMVVNGEGMKSTGHYRGEPDAKRFVIDLVANAMGMDMKIHMV
jgi:outer membrane lipoprotein-sorting protein